jgi:translocation and assembly module TamB
MGDLQTPLISGTITVDEGRIEASDLLDRLSARGYRRAPLDEADDLETGPYDRSALSITLEMGAVILRGRDLRSGSGPLGLGDINVTLGGALTIAKETAERPTLVGTVRIERGTYQFQGRQFAIARDSEIRFQGSPTNPALSIDATREIQGVTANVRLTGTLSEPDLALSSNPPLDQGDVLSLIVFNQAMNQLPTEQRVSLAARAGVLAAGAIATPLSESVRQALDLDTFEIRPAESASGASVVVGRQVSERLFVGFQHEFGGDEASQVSFEYRVNELLRVVTSLSEGRGSRSLRSGAAEAAAIDLIFVVR